MKTRSCSCRNQSFPAFFLPPKQVSPSPQLRKLLGGEVFVAILSDSGFFLDWSEKGIKVPRNVLHLGLIHGTRVGGVWVVIFFVGGYNRNWGYDYNNLLGIYLFFFFFGKGFGGKGRDKGRDGSGCLLVTLENSMGMETCSFTFRT